MSPSITTRHLIFHLYLVLHVTFQKSIVVLASSSSTAKFSRKIIHSNAIRHCYTQNPNLKPIHIGIPIQIRGGQSDDDIDNYEDSDGEKDYDDYSDYYDSANESDDGYDKFLDHKKDTTNKNLGPPKKKKDEHSSRSSSFRSPMFAAQTAAKLVSKTAGVVTDAASVSTRAAVGLASAKHVSIEEVGGVWRLDQQVGELPDGPFISCAANIEFNAQGDIFTTYNKQRIKENEPFHFVERSWPRYCTIEFEARAFQGPSNQTPVRMLYKGYFKRKIAKRSVIKMEGKIYAIKPKTGLWRKKEEVCVGTFTARKRLAALPRSFEDGQDHSENEFDDDYGYDNYDEYDEEY